MKDMPVSQALLMGWRGVVNYITDKPLVFSFEVTHSCTCNCRHCDRGGQVREETVLRPEDYADYVALHKPAAVQLSGGEPLLRKDLADIIRAIRGRSRRLPHLIVVTNGSLLNEERYGELKEAGADRFSVSLDFPDRRHDDFRRFPGLFAHLNETIPRLAGRNNGQDVVVNTAITKNNLPCLTDIVAKTEEWGVKISFSAYGVRRTGNREYFINSKDDLDLLERQIDRLIQIKKQNNRILNSVSALRKTYYYFRDGFIPDCNAGRRFFVVRPDGSFVPCSMRKHPRTYLSQRDMLERFVAGNQCGECYVAIRSYSDQTLGTLVKDNLSFFFSNLVK